MKLFKFAFLMILVGCAVPDQKLPEELELEKQRGKAMKTDDTRSIQSASGSVETFNSKREKGWNVKWKTATLDFSPQASQIGGSLQEVSGDIFKDNQLGSRYLARDAVLVKGSKTLTVMGGVKVISVIDGNSIECDTMIYNSDTGIIEAKGNVTVHQGGYVIKGETHIMANEKQQIVGTPDLFTKEMKLAEALAAKKAREIKK